ncbi:MAG: hypothetical protein IT170_11490 [Bryobacterales bacterium]|nr:hypothetical protein [Bryobacterales bacterium]
MSVRIDILKVGQADVPGPEVYWMSHWDRWETLHFSMAVLRGPWGTAIVNTGPPSNLEPLNSAWRAFAGERCKLRRDPDEEPVAALAAIGIRPEEVNAILLTPLQAYTTANIPRFRNARIYCSRRGWIEEIVARKASLHVPRELCVPDDVLHYLLFEGRERLHLLDDEATIANGLRAWWAGTHHRSSMVYEVDAGSGTVLIGDCAFKYGNLDGPPLGIAESLEEAERAYSRIRKSGGRFLPLYDPEVFERHAGGRVA